MPTEDDTDRPIAGQHAPAGGSHEPPRSSWPTILALLLVAAVWLLGCVWSFTEQTAFARSHHFAVPELLPLILDGMATALAGVAYAASLDGRPAIGARLGTAVAVAISAASNGLWAAERSGQDPITIGLAVVVPCTAMLAFEVLLGELRRQVQRRRGDPAPVRIPYPRLVRLALAPVSTFTAWRRLVLEMTALPPAGRPPAAAARPPQPEAPPPAEAPARAEPTSAAAAPQAESESAESSRPAPEPAARPEDTEPRRPPATRPQPAAPVATEAARPAPPRSRPAPRTSTPASRTRPPAGEAPAARPRRAPVESGAVPTMQDLHVGDERVGHIAGMLRRGEEPTGEQVGAMFNCSPRTGRRLVEKARAMLADHPHLQVVASAPGQR